jgi:DNA repair exonuclease SbcCD ATPase subunit
MTEQGSLHAVLEQHRELLQQAETALREQRAELARLLADFKSLYTGLHGGTDTSGQAEALTEENEYLRKLLADKEREVHEADADSALPRVLQELEDVQGENRQLRQLLIEKDRELAERNEAAPPVGENIDVDTFEAELNRYRQQLEADRQKLNAELQQVRVRNQELDDATREIEMEFSRERAELARERTRLERLREEVRADLERLQRDSGMRESLLPVQRLREQFSQK